MKVWKGGRFGESDAQKFQKYTLEMHILNLWKLFSLINMKRMMVRQQPSTYEQILASDSD